eukprot:1532193-Pyramimonas_sp.AAC.1
MRDAPDDNNDDKDREKTKRERTRTKKEEDGFPLQNNAKSRNARFTARHVGQVTLQRPDVC